jgi:hypothetical protein
MPDLVSAFERGRQTVIDRRNAEITLMRQSMDLLMEQQMQPLQLQYEAQKYNLGIQQLESQAKLLPLQHQVDQARLSVESGQAQTALRQQQVEQAIVGRHVTRFEEGLEKEATLPFGQEHQAERDRLSGELQTGEDLAPIIADLQDELEFVDGEIERFNGLPEDQRAARPDELQQLTERRAEVQSSLESNQATIGDIEAKRGRVKELEDLSQAPSPATEHYIGMARDLDATSHPALQGVQGQVDGMLDLIYNNSPDGSPDRKAISGARNQARMRVLEKHRAMMPPDQREDFDSATSGITSILQGDQDFGAQWFDHFMKEVLPDSLKTATEDRRTMQKAILSGMSAGSEGSQGAALIDPARPVFEFKSADERTGYLFSSRMTEELGRMEGILRDNPAFKPGAVQTAIVKALTDRNFVYKGSSPIEQQWVNSASRWIRAKLRKESGASIGKEEAEQEARAFLPQPGESEESIQDKLNSLRSQTRDQITAIGNGPAANFLFDRLNPTTQGGQLIDPTADLFKDAKRIEIKEVPGAQIFRKPSGDYFLPNGSRLPQYNASAYGAALAKTIPPGELWVDEQGRVNVGPPEQTAPALGAQPQASPSPPAGSGITTPPSTTAPLPPVPSPQALIPQQSRSGKNATAQQGVDPTGDVPEGPTQVAASGGFISGQIMGKAIKQAPRPVGIDKPLIKPKAIVFHASAATQKHDELIGSMSREGYHLTIDKDGTVAQHWPLDRIASHAREGGYNWRSIGISLVGTDNDKGKGKRYIDSDSRTTLPATPAQLKAAKKLVGELQTMFPTLSEFVGHGETDRINRAHDEGLDVAQYVRGESSPAETPKKDYASGTLGAMLTSASSPGNDDSGWMNVQATRFGYDGDPYGDRNSTRGIGNRSNRLEPGSSIALKASTAAELGIDLKGGEMVDVMMPDGTIETLPVDDTIPKESGDEHRIDFYDPSGQRKSIDGSKIKIRRSRASEA